MVLLRNQPVAGYHSAVRFAQVAQVYRVIELAPAPCV